MSSKVLFAPMAYSKFDPNQTLPAKFERVLEQSELKDMVSGGKSVAIKMHVGDNLTYSTIPPVFVRILVSKVKEWGGKPFITDHAMLDRNPSVRGYSENVLGCPVTDIAGLLDKYYYTKEVDYKTFRHMDIGGHIHDADVLIDFSHIKGHGSCGFGGACKNLAMGCVSTRTRGELHALEGGIIWEEDKCIHCDACITACNHYANSFDENGKYQIDYHACTFCQHCSKVCPTGAVSLTSHYYDDFQHGMALATKEVLDTFGKGNYYFISLLTQITALCDCWGMTTPALVPDIGLMASSDIVAIERACVDAIKEENFIPEGLPKDMELGEGKHLLEKIHGRDPFVQIRALESFGLGTQDYELVTVE